MKIERFEKFESFSYMTSHLMSPREIDFFPEIC